MLKLVGTGGTFDHLHEGHKLLIETALKISNNVVIGLTTKEMLKNKKYASSIQDFDTRKRNIEKFISTITNLDRVRIIKLSDPYGPPIKDPDYEGLVSSQETFSNAVKLNELRESNGLKPLIIITIPIIKGENNKKISSTAIRAKNK